MYSIVLNLFHGLFAPVVRKDSRYSGIGCIQVAIPDYFLNEYFLHFPTLLNVVCLNSESGSIRI